MVLCGRLVALLVLLSVCGPVLGFVHPGPAGRLPKRIHGPIHQGSARPRQGVAPVCLVPESVEAGTALIVAGETWATPVKAVLEPVLNLGSLAFLIRIVLSWYPQVDLNKLPTNLVAWPTEPFLKVTRMVVPPAFGVDISPIVWVAFLSFLKEILTSQQGILTLLEQR